VCIAKGFVLTLRAIGGGPELSEDLRSCAHGNYVIFFESTPEQVTIVRILHGARDISEVLNPS
jgi:toxin ParE1/3/4